MDASFERTLQTQGARFGTVLGVSVPLRFAAAENEYRAAREACAMWAADVRRLLTVTGEDRVTFLQGMLSNDVKVLRPGEGTYAALLTQQGKIVSDVRVYADSGYVLLDVLAERVTAVISALEKFIVADDVELNVRDDEQPLIGLMGPAAAATLEAVLKAKLPEWQALSHQNLTVAGRALRVIAVGETNESGLLLCGAAAVRAEVWSALLAAGAQPIGMETLNVLRVEAGVPWYGIDMDDEVLLMETNLDRAVSFTKGCYLGQEVVERVAARGHVNKKLTGLAIDGDQVPPPATTLRADGRDVGRITSAVRSPAHGRIIGLGYVHRDSLTPGTVLRAVMAEGEAAVVVTTLP
jgi:aminomethyltransferase